MSFPQFKLIVQGFLAVLLLGAYLVLTLTGHDANLIFGVLVGQMSALGIERVSTPGSGGGGQPSH